jgi:hypothetical protein
MISNPMKYLGTLSLLLTLALLVSTFPNKVAAQTSGPFQQERVKLLVKGMDPDEAMADQAKLILTLKDFGVQRPPGSIKNWIETIQESNEPVMRGLGGVSAHSLLWVASKTVNPGHGGYSQRPGVETYGQIQEECDGESGYSYDSATGSGRLCVTMTTITTRGNSGITQTNAMKIKVTVSAGGFNVEEKDLTFSDNVFPNFAREAGLMVGSGAASGFNYKLWASGNTISVDKVWIFDPSINDFREIDPATNPGDAMYSGLFDPDPEACIDMMFVGDPPSALPADAAPPYYCLGRCANPPIINTK